MDFKKREDALKEGLAKNEEETARWENFKNENKKASENMEMFIKKYNIDVLVPIGGGKAFMPGYLYHTNEILVGHYNGLYSKCSTSKAQEIVKYRLNLAKERLENLRKEKELFQNNLNFPYTNDVLSNEDKQEFLLHWSEEELENWREEHKKKVRESKQKDKEREDENDEQTYEDIMERLDYLELMEELDQELENMEVDDSDTLQKIMSGEIKLPPTKHKKSHENSNVVLGDNSEVKRNKMTTDLDLNSSLEEVYKKYKCEKTSESLLNNNFTNNNSVPNTEDFSEENSDDSSREYSDIEQEIQDMRIKEKIKYFKTKIKEIEESIDTLKITNVEEYDQKLSLLELRDYLIDRLEILKDQNEVDDNDNNSSINATNNVESKITKTKKLKKKISFALEDEIKFINKEESVDSMMKSKINNKKEKDIIVLDADIYSRSNSISNKGNNENEVKEKQENIVIDKKTLILNKVEQSCNFVSENQSQQDFDLVGKILNTYTNATQPKTLYIRFEHSNKFFEYPGYEKDENCTYEEKIIGSPADIYKMYPQYFGVECQTENKLNDNEIKNQNHIAQEKMNMNMEDNRKNAKVPHTDDVNAKQQIEYQENMKSILKNKEAVQLETHITEEKQEKQQKKKKRNKNKDDFMCYEMIVGDVIENPTKESEPYIEGKYIDVHAPKKRISRFKQMRDCTVKAKS